MSWFTTTLSSSVGKKLLMALTGGFVGFMAYDFVRRLERLPSTTVDDLGLPDMCWLLVADLAAFDHHEGTITLIANAINFDGSFSP